MPYGRACAIAQLTGNRLLLLGKASRGDTVLANYSYLSDGTKRSAVGDDGEGFVYLGSLVYRIPGDSRLLESCSSPGGRLVAQGPDASTFLPYYFLTDHLGSVRAVVAESHDGDRVLRTILEHNDYYPFGSRWEDPESLLSDNRYRYNGKEEQAFVGLPYIDYGARQLLAPFHIWLTQDPLAEKYYTVSPYAFCDNNPIIKIDKDGRIGETLWDVANIAIGTHSFVQNISEGNVGGAIVDGIGVALDVVAAAIPFVPGGVGTIIKTVRSADKATDAVQAVDKATDAARAIDNATTPQRTFQTYVKKTETGRVYSGRTSGTDDPIKNVYRRDRYHHKNKEGYGPAELDFSSSNPDAIRGREQQLIEENGGAISQGGTSGNAINGISPDNPKRKIYEEARKREFGR